MRDRERGSAILEFGLIAVVLFAFIFGIIDFGRALFTYHFVANAAREGARYASVRGYACGQNSEFAGSMECPASQITIQTYVQGEASGSGLNQNFLNVTANWYPQVKSPNNPSVCQQYNTYPGCMVQVKVTYPFSFILPLMPKGTCSVQNNSGTTNTGNICITSTSEMVITQ
jgi:Flp pilus assembly protein TadG